MTLFAIDLMNMAHRAYHSVSEGNRLSNSRGVPTFMIYGVVSQLERLIRDYRPTHFVIGVDLKAKTFRHELFEGYKSNRSVSPDDFLAQIPNLYRVLDAYGFKSLKVEGYEADDLIGSAVVKFQNEVKCTIVSADKDYMQLVNDNVNMLRPRPAGWELCDADGVREKFGCDPEQVVDVLAIMGDAADAVPGVKGLGEKGAVKLVKSFKDLDGIYENLHKTTPAVCAKLINDKDMAFLSKQLVTIKTDIPLDVTLEDLRTPDFWSRPERAEILKELEFYSLLRR